MSQAVVIKLLKPVGAKWAVLSYFINKNWQFYLLFCLLDEDTIANIVMFIRPYLHLALDHIFYSRTSIRKYLCTHFLIKDFQCSSQLTEFLFPPIRNGPTTLCLNQLSIWVLNAYPSEYKAYFNALMQCFYLPFQEYRVSLKNENVEE